MPNANIFREERVVQQGSICGLFWIIYIIWFR